MFGILIEAHRIGLQKRSHLVNEGTGSSGTDTVHPLLDIAPLKVNDFGILSAQLDGHVCLRSQFFQRRGYGDHFLYERNVQVIGQRKSAGTGDHRMYGQVTAGGTGFLQQGGQGFLDIGEMPFIIRKKQLMIRIQYGDFHRRGTDINTKCIMHINSPHW